MDNYYIFIELQTKKQNKIIVDDKRCMRNSSVFSSIGKHKTFNDRRQFHRLYYKLKQTKNNHTHKTIDRHKNLKTKQTEEKNKATC